MLELAWRLGPLATLDEAAVVDAVEARFRQIYQASFSNEPSCNHRLPVQVRALRQIGDWWVFQLLTPWMLARLLLPRQSPPLAVPAGWQAENRSEQSYVVIGPVLTVALPSGSQRAHINFDVVLGHYLIQPLAQSMQDYADADAVFTAWNDVIATRDRVMDEQGKDCPWQREVSRREWFSRLLRGKR